jgi:tape measure domain-containing protein
MANGGDINYTISANGSQAIQTFGTISKSLSHMQQAGYRLMQAGAVISAAITAPLLKAAQVGIVFDSMIEQATISFTTMTGDAAQGVKLVTDLIKVANDTPLEVSDVQTAAQMLLAFGLSAEKIIPTIQMLGDATLGNKDRFQALSLAFAQMTAAGRLMGQDLLQMINAGFNPLLVISEETGLSMLELRKKMEAGAISSEMVTEAFKIATSEGGKFFNAMENSMDSWEGVMSRLKQSTQTALGKVVQPLFDKLRLEVIPKLIEVIDNLVEKWDSLSEKTKNTILSVLGVVAAFGGILVIVGGVIFALTTLSIVIGAIGTTALLIVAGIAALIYIIVRLWKTSENFREGVRKVWNGIVGIIENAINTIGGLWNQYGVAIIESIMLAWNSLVEFMQPVVEFFKKLFVKLVSDLGPVWENIKGALKNLWETFKSVWAALKPVLIALGVVAFGVFTAIVSVIAGCVSAIAPMINAIVSGVNTIAFAMQALFKLLKGDTAGAWDALKESGKSLVETLGYVAEAGVALVTTTIDSITTMGESAKKTFTAMADDADALKQTWKDSAAGNSINPGDYLGDEKYTFNPIQLKRWTVGDDLEEVNTDLEETTTSMSDFGTTSFDALTSAADAAEELADSVKNAMDSFADFGSMFEKKIIEKMSPQKILRRLQQTFTQMANWSKSLTTLQERGVSSEIIDSLRGMGLAGAGIAAGMARMSDEQLSKAQDLMWGSRIIGGYQANEKITFEHTGKIWIYGVNEEGDLVDTGIIDMLTEEIRNGTLRYVDIPGVSKTFK